MKILVISLAGIGDTLFATPLIHELRANFPEAQIDALVLWRGSKDILEGNPHLNTIYQKNLIASGTYQSVQFLLSLRKQGYDITLNTHPQSRIHYRAAAWLVGARTRVSHRYHNSNILDELFITGSVEQNYDQHAIENNLALLKLIGVKKKLPGHDYELFLSPAEAKWAEDYVAQNKLARRKILGIHVGSGGTKNLALRRWPLENFLELIQTLGQTHPRLAVLLFGGPEEEKDHAKILAATSRDQVFEVKTPGLRQAAALLKKCAAFLSVDTALMHLAAAMKVPGQMVIETPTWNKPIEPRNAFTLIKNPAVAGRNLDFYRYDGRGIKGSPGELRRCMAVITAQEVHAISAKALDRLPGAD
ncbi:MAG TPA: glycosyltransferase family 9 protein [Verrucomicrobiae bacterium]|nr:glycosyltransferase family 9 protein [Verrucomicrobiae bacterium]